MHHSYVESEMFGVYTNLHKTLLRDDYVAIYSCHIFGRKKNVINACICKVMQTTSHISRFIPHCVVMKSHYESYKRKKKRLKFSHTLSYNLDHHVKRVTGIRILQWSCGSKKYKTLKFKHSSSSFIMAVY